MVKDSLTFYPDAAEVYKYMSLFVTAKSWAVYYLTSLLYARSLLLPTKMTVIFDSAFYFN